MPQPILILPESITNKIAAGEVVERPASVIKELIENALDADASDITVEISNGGRRLIRISDNGHGMSREDALLSLERHATSKIRTDSDLEGILTLGFRGEALPSIASVSRFRLATRRADSLEGTEIIVEGGKVKDVRVCGMAPGTVITVEQLFFNTPARLKFMRGAETETGHVGDVVARMAIARPEVGFNCISDGKEMLRVQRGDLHRRLAQLVGKGAAADLHAVDHNEDLLSITGFISAPATARSTTASMFTYVNGRFVRDKVVQHAILQAYRGVIDRGRYPVVALFIKLGTGEVDVNVHPTKHEVRFRRQSFIHDSIQQALEDVLTGSPWLKHKTTPAVSSTAGSQIYQEKIATALQATLNLPRRETNYPCSPGTEPTGVGATTNPPAYLSGTAVHEPTASFPSIEVPVAEGYFSSLTIIGQFHAEYILCQSGTELIIIDQHAASERVAYQRLQQQFVNSGVESQRLLFPETLELTFAEVAVTKRFQADLLKMGFELEPFGGNTVIVAAMPRIAAGDTSQRLVRDILGELAALGTNKAFQESQDSLLARIACHSVVRGVHPLDKLQIAQLLTSMDETAFAGSCPHGRPVSHTIALAELEKIFKRT
ncbi:MAG TPA: DNA mismatch repair endonuclease MutL [Desulfuromonadaceae bacterium]